MANIKISELNELETRHRNDLLPIVDSVNNETKKVKVENLINENVELIAVSPTAPSECSLGDKYFNTTSNKIYTAIATDTWSSTGENAVEGILYVVFGDQSTYAYDGTTLISVGGGSGSSDIVIVGDESEATEDTKLLVDTTGTTDTLKYKDNGSFTELQIKALDSMPVGSEIDFDGQASDIPVGWEEVSGKSYVAYDLYNNASGTTGTVTLSDSVNNYEYIEIYFTSSGYAGSKKIDLSISTSFMINLPFIYNTAYYDKMSKYSISGNTITYNESISINSNFSSVVAGSNEILIKKVIGYKEV